MYTNEQNRGPLTLQASPKHNKANEVGQIHNKLLQRPFLLENSYFIYKKKKKTQKHKNNDNNKEVGQTQ